MTADEIKSQYSMRDIVGRYGFHPNRAGFISCPFHKGDRTPSMKIYEKSYHCHACGADGDIFSFIQNIDNCDFKTAFYQLGGTYEKPTFESNMALYRARKAKEKAKNKELSLAGKILLNNLLISVYQEWSRRSELFSDAWCDCMNKLEYQLYIYEILHEKR